MSDQILQGVLKLNMMGLILIMDIFRLISLFNKSRRKIKQNSKIIKVIKSNSNLIILQKVILQGLLRESEKPET